VFFRHMASCGGGWKAGKLVEEGQQDTHGHKQYAE
jgi:hypothetical protein